MDWNLKAVSWDFTEFEREAIPSILDTFNRSSSFGEQRTRGEFSIDLKLGQIGSSTDKSTSKWKEPGAVKMESFRSGPTKRARGANNGVRAMCLVDGCNSDLSTCRDYHRRHKVCELHSKTPQVTIGGHKQRFCQQCSRFHSLEEFDEGKRSCRKRLDGHNRRRRKPPPDPLSRTGSFLRNYQGTQLLAYSTSHVYPSATVLNPTWSAVVNNNEENARNCNLLHQQIHSPEKQGFFLGSPGSSYKGGKHFPFLQSHNLTLTNQTTPASSSSSSSSSVCQPLLSSIALSESNNNNNNSSSSIGTNSGHGLFCDSLTKSTQAANSDCALSLLSSTQQTQGSGNHHHHHHLMQRLGSSSPLGHGLATMDSLLVSNRREAEVHSQGIFDIQSSRSSGNKATQALPFSWE
ncbi:hypothetical protein Tsubulata_043959 [Turnera subulata]|uniref:SBP-type domain-containing protein n=1 Tax=Turnera subulata TaxID=218843 RepID=A0A9Q0GK51_9ROSI|nr:hypothetical protein Tsubulata_043959 [Turnera subulata]